LWIPAGRRPARCAGSARGRDLALAEAGAGGENNLRVGFPIVGYTTDVAQRRGRPQSRNWFWALEASSEARYLIRNVTWMTGDLVSSQIRVLVPIPAERTLESVWHHFEVEHGIAARLMAADREGRKRIYATMYDELFAQVP